MPAFGGAPNYGRIDERSTTVIRDENSGLIRQRRTYAPPFALDRGGDTFEGRNLADRDINPWTHTQRDAGGNYARYIFPPSCNRYPRSARLPRAGNLCFGTGMIRFATTSPRRRCADELVYGAAITSHGTST